MFREISLYLADEAHELWLKTEDELAEIGLPPPFWAFAWAGGQGLARHVLDRPEIVRGRDVLDFASGSGLVAIAALKAGAKSVVAADIDPFSATAVAMNAAANGVVLDHSSADLIGRDHGWDVVLAGDVFYDRALAARLTPWFDALTRRGAAVLIGDPGRSYLPKASAGAARRLPDRGDARAGGCRGQAHHGLALRLTLSASRRSIPATKSGRQA